MPENPKLPGREKFLESKKKLPYRDQFVPKTEEEQTLEREKRKSDEIRRHLKPGMTAMDALKRMGK